MTRPEKLQDELDRKGLELRAPANEAEVDGYGHVVHVCFGSPVDDARAYAERQVREDIQVLLHEGETVGGLLRVPMGQWFGGRSVPMVGIAAVGVLPEARGRGFAGAMMRAAVADMAADGHLLSALYPATQTLYRSAGYDLAGQRFAHAVTLAGLEHTPRSELNVRLAGVEDFVAMEAAQRTWARAHDGTLDRGPYIWQRARQPRGSTAMHYVVENSAGQSGTPGEGAPCLEGYLGLRQTPRADVAYGYDLELSDLVVTTAEAGRALLHFLGTHTSLSSTVTLHGGACPELLALLPEWRVKSELPIHWMHRLLDLPAALRARGYAPQLSGRVSFALEDELCLAQAGVWTLSVEGGVPSVERGGNAQLRLSARGAASVFGGFQSPQIAARRGLLSGEPEALVTLGALLSSRGPFMGEMF